MRGLFQVWTKGFILGILVSTLGNITIINAQDIQFSQFYSNVLYLNPALCGNAHALRGIGHQRVQWPSLDAKYLTSSLSIDNYFSKTNSAIGIMFLKDWQ